MVQVKLINQIITIRGRFGGVYFKTGRPGQHIQAMPRTVNYTRSGVQGGFRDMFTAGAVIWMLALLGFYASLWAAYALVNLFIDEHGESKRISGYNWYQHYALTFPERDEFHPFWQPPHAPGDLPNYVAVYQGKWMYYKTPSEWPTDCCGGYYWESTVPWNGKTAYRTDDFNWHIWWKDPVWACSPGPGFEPAGKTFYSPGPEICDWYKNPVTNLLVHIYNGKRPGYES